MNHSSAHGAVPQNVCARRLPTDKSALVFSHLKGLVCGVCNGRMGEINPTVEDSHFDALSSTLSYQFHDFVSVNQLFKRRHVSVLVSLCLEPCKVPAIFANSVTPAKARVQERLNPDGETGFRFPPE